MSKTENRNNFIKKPIAIILSLVITLIITGIVYYLRIKLFAPFKLVNGISLILIVLDIISLCLVVRDKEATSYELFIESLPSIIFFIGFFVCKLILRG